MKYFIINIGDTMATQEELNNREYSYDNGFRPHPWNIPENYQFYNNRLGFRILRRLEYLTMSIFFILFGKIRYHLKICNKQNKRELRKIMKKEGAIITCNHIFPNDASLLMVNLQPKLIFTPTLQSNMGFGIISTVFRLAGVVPVPEELKDMRNFDEQTLKALERKETICFMAEGSLILWSGHVRNFQRGALKYAQMKDKKIVPTVYTLHAHSKKKKGKRPYLKLHYLAPYEIKNTGNRRQDLIDATKELQTITNDYFVTHSDPIWLDEIGLKRRNELLTR